MTKKKKGQDGDGEDDREQSRTPIRSELDKQEGSVRALRMCIGTVFFTKFLIWLFLFFRAEKEQTPLQEALYQLIRQLQRCNTGYAYTDNISNPTGIRRYNEIHVISLQLPQSQ